MSESRTSHQYSKAVLPSLDETTPTGPSLRKSKNFEAKAVGKTASVVSASFHFEDECKYLLTPR